MKIAILVLVTLSALVYGSAEGQRKYRGFLRVNDHAKSMTFSETLGEQKVALEGVESVIRYLCVNKSCGYNLVLSYRGTDIAASSVPSGIPSTHLELVSPSGKLRAVMGYYLVP